MQPPDDDDDARVGDIEHRLSDFRLLNQALSSAAALLESWNRTALDHGAIEAPYTHDVERLRQMADWGGDALSQPVRFGRVVVKGVTVGSQKYEKAALLLAAAVEEKKLESHSADWPVPVRRAARGRVERLRQMASAIGHTPANFLSELVQSPADQEWDVFISHAREDKQSLVDQLAAALVVAGFKVWYDAMELSLGDSLRRTIDLGLSRSRFGVVVLSPAFFAKEWPQRELDGLAAREADGVKVILPVWHGVGRDEVCQYSPTLADRLAVSSTAGVDQIVLAISGVLRKG